MLSPPRDYPDQHAEQHKGKRSSRAIGKTTEESGPITVRSVLDRLDSEQLVTDDMIHKAVTNLHSEDTLSRGKKAARKLPRSLRQKKPVFLPETLRSLFKTVIRN